jgi:hypothetical protein
MTIRRLVSETNCFRMPAATRTGIGRKTTHLTQ